MCLAGIDDFTKMVKFRMDDQLEVFGYIFEI